MNSTLTVGTALSVPHKIAKVINSQLLEDMSIEGASGGSASIVSGSSLYSYINNPVDTSDVIILPKTIRNTSGLSLYWRTSSMTLIYEGLGNQFPTPIKTEVVLVPTRGLKTYKVINEFLAAFALKFTVVEYKKAFDFLRDNEILIPLISNTIDSIEKYFDNRIEDLILKVKEDFEDETNYKTLYLQIKFKGSIREAYETLSRFQSEWLVPKVGKQIMLFNVDIV